MATFKIEYTAHKSLAGGFKPIVMINGQPQYFPERNKKTLAGALRTARRIAENTAVGWKSASSTNVVSIAQYAHLKIKTEEA